MATASSLSADHEKASLNSWFTTARDKLIMRYTDENVELRALANSSCLPFTSTFPLNLSICGSTYDGSHGDPRPKVWGTLQFHACFQSHKFNAVLAAEARKHSRYTIVPVPFVGIAFRNADKNIASRLTRVVAYGGERGR